jgi:hypothetical protein
METKCCYYFVVFAAAAALIRIVIAPVVDEVFVFDGPGFVRYNSVSVGKQFRRFERL